MIIQDGLRRMFAEQEDVYYYITVMNENYAHPAMPEGAAPDILKGMYKLRDGSDRARVRACSCMGSGVILRQAMAAAELLKNDWGVERGHLELPVVHRARARRQRSHALEHAAPGADAAQVARRDVPRGDHRARDRGHRLHAPVRRADPRRSCRGAMSCSAPTASGARTRARSCARSSRSIRSTSRSPR